MTGLLRSQAAQLQTIARSWEADGATAFGVWLNGTRWMTTPEGADLDAATLIAPITIGRRQLGELRTTIDWSAARQQRLEADAASIASALRLEEELQRMTAELIECQDQLLAVFNLARAVRRHLSIDEVLTALVSEARDLIQGAIAFVALDTEGSRRLVTSPSIPSAAQEAVFWGLLDHVRQTRRPLLFSEPGDWPLATTLPETNAGGVVVPVSIDDRLQAALGVFNQDGTTSTAGTVKLLRAIADQAGSLIESAIVHQQVLDRERIEREMELAAEVQRTLLVRKQPVVDGLDLASAYHPAFEVCGDFFDLIMRDDGRLVFTVADVTGKGLPAAFVMAMTRVRLRSAAAWLAQPSDALDRTNLDLYDDLTGVSRFVTAFTGFYDPTTRVVDYANCGHSPVIFCPANGQAHMLDAEQPPLGILDGAFAETQSLTLGPDDVLVVATDGFPETRDPTGEFFDYDRMFRLIEDNRDRSADEIAAALFEAVNTFSDAGPQEDDRTVIVLKGAAR